MDERKLTEQELLLLSNYVYMDASTDGMTIGESIGRFKNAQGTFDENSVAKAGIGGGMSPEQAADLFTRMDAMPDSFRNLYPSRVKNDADFRGICFTDGKKDGGGGTVVFRGTGGTYDAWHDNVVGEYLPSTAIQKEAADFVRYDCMGFSDLTVTGHSKGGNLAMYTTVMCPASVAACVSFDGQGFSRAFLEAYAQAVETASGKIRSISAHNDFVNILLHSIAGEAVYAKNGAGGIDAHSSYCLLTENDFDENGNLTSLCAQSFGAWALSEVLSEMTDCMDILPEDGNEEISNLLAAYVAAIMSEDKGKEFEEAQIENAKLSTGQYLLGLLPGVRTCGQEVLRIDTFKKDAHTVRMEEAAGGFEHAGRRIADLAMRLEVLQNRIDPDEHVWYYVNQIVSSLLKRMNDHKVVLDTYANMLRQITELYVAKEQALASEISLSI